jgi:hypothetical protein
MAGGSSAVLRLFTSPYVLSCAVLFLCLGVCCIVQLMSCRYNRKQNGEDMPLLARSDSPVDRGDDGIAHIGTPARDFVRLSSLPPSIFRHDEDQRRCLACGEAGKCVALRPCGHVVLCRACSDFVYTCPHCGQYISGVGLRRSDDPGGRHQDAEAGRSHAY